MITKVYGESALSKVRAYEWYKRFRESREDVEGAKRSGRPSTSTTDENVEKTKETVMNDRRITIREIRDDVDVSIGSCHGIISDVRGMKGVAPKFVEFRTETAVNEVPQDSPDYVDVDAESLKRTKTGEKTRIYGYDVETKAPIIPVEAFWLHFFKQTKIAELMKTR